MKVFLLTLFLVSVLSCSPLDLCSTRGTGWYCCQGDSVYCENNKYNYGEICPRGCNINSGYCSIARWCELKSRAQSTYCNITYLVDRQTDFTIDDTEARTMVANWLNTSNVTCSEDLYRMVACHEIYVPCDESSMNSCKKYTKEASECDPRINPNQCIWSGAEKESKNDERNRITVVLLVAFIWIISSWMVFT